MRLKNKRGASVIETLIIVAIMGALGITVLSVLNRTLLTRTSAIDQAIIGSELFDVDHLMTQK